MAKDYSKNVATAKRLITKFGQSLTFIKYPPDVSGYDENGNEIVPPAPTTAEGNGVKLDYTKRDVDGENILFGDCLCYFSLNDGEPEIESRMEVKLDGEVWRVINPSPLQPAGVVVFYEIQLRL